MSYVFYNPNPYNKLIGDCVIRAISKAINKDWNTVYLEVMMKGFYLKDMPSSNHVWGSYLKDNGFDRFMLPNTCPECYTIREFCMDYPYGIYIAGTGSHVVAVVDGNYFDSWDSGGEVPIYYFKRRE